MTGSFPRDVPNRMTVADLVHQTAGEATIHGNPSREIASVGSLENANQESLAFCRFEGTQASDLISRSSAGVIIVSDAPSERPDRSFIVTPDPRGWFIDALGVLFYETVSSSIHPEASIGSGAMIGEGVSIGAFSRVEDGAVIGDGCIIGDHCVVTGGATLGEGVRMQSHSVVGATGLSFHERPSGQRAFFPHLGRAYVGKGVSIGTHTVIVRGIVEDTVLGEACMIGNQVNIGHNVQVGDEVFISSGSLIAGGSSIGQGALIAAGVRISSHVEIGARAVVGLGSVVVKPVPDGGRVFGNPAKPVPALRRF